jgi:hypothetical protein
MTNIYKGKKFSGREEKNNSSFRRDASLLSVLPKKKSFRAAKGDFLLDLMPLICFNNSNQLLGELGKKHSLLLFCTFRFFIFKQLERLTVRSKVRKDLFLKTESYL